MAKNKVLSAFEMVVFLGIAIGMFMAIMFIGEDTLSQIRLINILMTLGGLETYDQTVIGTSIIVFLLGMVMIAIFGDD